MAKMEKVKSSFRDPGNQVFRTDGEVVRQIRPASLHHYRKLMESGLYDRLVSDGLLIPHQDVSDKFPEFEGIVIRPERVPLISYPFEWSFSSLKTAALKTLEIQKHCLDFGMTLQDATAFNMQFYNGAWVLIDTGSFCIREKGSPWGAYRQFCQHFLAPLLLMAYCDPRLLSLFSKYLDGIPLDLADRLLPLKAKLRLSVLLHITLHSRFAAKEFASDDLKKSIQKNLSDASVYGLLDQLASLIRSLDIRKQATVWTQYEDTHTYDSDEFRQKENFVVKTVQKVNPRTVWDLGANTGHFSRVIAGVLNEQSLVLALEYDFMTVEAGDRKSALCTKNRPLHLWSDLFNPVSGHGWAGQEWPGLQDRGPADFVLALALVHHICLGGNVTFEQLFSFLSVFAKDLVIEFVPKSDPQSQRLLRSKGDIFPEYTMGHFENCLQRHFSVLDKTEVSKTGRTIYHLKNKTLQG